MGRSSKGETLEELFTVLELKVSATTEDVRQAYKKLAMKFHPDKTEGLPEAVKRESEERFKQISHAYEILTDPEKRRKLSPTLSADSYSDDENNRSYKRQGSSRSSRTPGSHPRANHSPNSSNSDPDSRKRPSPFMKSNSTSPSTRFPSVNLGTPAMGYTRGSPRGRGGTPKGVAGGGFPERSQVSACLFSTRAWVMVLSLVLAGLLATGQGLRGSVMSTFSAQNRAPDGTPIGWETEKLLRPSIRISGSCPELARYVDGDFVAIGSLNGRPKYRQRSSKSILYFDPSCGDVLEASWHIKKEDTASNGKVCESIARLDWVWFCERAGRVQV